MPNTNQQIIDLTDLKLATMAIQDSMLSIHKSMRDFEAVHRKKEFDQRTFDGIINEATGQCIIIMPEIGEHFIFPDSIQTIINSLALAPEGWATFRIGNEEGGVRLITQSNRALQISVGAYQMLHSAVNESKARIALERITEWLSRAQKAGSVEGVGLTRAELIAIDSFLDKAFEFMLKKNSNSPAIVALQKYVQFYRSCLQPSNGCNYVNGQEAKTTTPTTQSFFQGTPTPSSLVMNTQDKPQTPEEKIAALQAQVARLEEGMASLRIANQKLRVENVGLKADAISTISSSPGSSSFR